MLKNIRNNWTTEKTQTLEFTDHDSGKIVFAKWSELKQIYEEVSKPIKRGQHLSGAGSSPAGSVGWDLNLQKLNYQYLTISVAVVLVVR